jgi:hypothetical protein
MKVRIILLLLAAVFLTAERHGNFQEMDSRKPRYIKRKSDAWKEGGRIIGEIKYPPDSFTIKVMHVGTKNVIYTYKHPAALSVYRTKRLPPGTYDLLIESGIFVPYRINNVKIKARSDCLINLIFNKRVYNNDL